MQRARATVVAILLATSFGRAQGPLTTAFTYQGELRSAGTPATGPYDLRFRLYDGPTGGTQLGPTLCSNNAALAEGRFTVELDFGAQFAGQQRFLEIEVRADTGLDCSNLAGFTLLGPRQPITVAPNAAYALNAGSATSAATAATATTANQLNGQPPSFYQDAGNLSQGTLPSARLSGTYAEQLQLNNPLNTISGVLSGTGVGITQLNAASLVTGSVPAARLPVPMILDAFGATPVIRAQTSSTSAGTAAFLGLALANTGDTAGGSFSTSGNAGSGVKGFATAGSGTTFGGYFEDWSATGYGCYGRTTAGSGVNTGVLGQSGSTSGMGVWGYASNTSGGSSTKGVHGQNASGAGYGVYSSGNFGASGTKAFRIDHPADPENTYLLHYSIESPEVLNAYSGKITLDDRGEATVTLPAYFARINRDPRYTLTAIGAAMPALHIAQEIDEHDLELGAEAAPSKPAPACSFVIAGGAPGAKVSWEVKALRNDPWVRASGAPVEQPKPASERGTYQHPELYSKPATLATSRLPIHPKQAESGR
jgi:hypothetical protein